MTKKDFKIRVKHAFLRLFFGILAVFMGVNIAGAINEAVTGEPISGVLTAETVYAEPEDETTSGTSSSVTSVLTGTTDDKNWDESCQNSLGSLAWLVCPTTGKISEAVDWLYEKIEDILVINPIAMEDGSPIYEIWKYCLGVTNIVFIIFLLIVIYSQLTGFGINNYGIKKALPKLIVAAVLVNLSFVICSLAVDVSNIVGSSLRGVFTAVQEATLATTGSGEAVATATTAAERLKMAQMQETMASGGVGMAIALGVIGFETGAIWMLIPVVLGAIVAVASGLITIALRQAVVALLIMISPLAIVAYILPNTEDLFKKWKKLLIRMLTFYPLFSLLFGASSLAGFAIIAAAKDGFGLLLGMAVQIFPLFFSWKLMQMSGTFLGDINTRIRGLAARPLATNRAWADSHRLASKQKYLSGRAITPSLRLMQFVSNRKVAREAEIDERSKEVKERGLAYRARKNYKHGDVYGTLSKRGEESYERQARIMEYQQISTRDKNNFNKGFGYTAAKGTALRARLDALDTRNVKASDLLKVEQARGEKIEYENTVGFYNRMEGAINAHMDLQNGFVRDSEGKLVLDGSGRRIRKETYKFHFDPNNLEQTRELAHYNAMHQIMDGSEVDIQFAAAGAAHAYDTQKKIIENKMQKYFEMLPPTKDVEFRLSELTKQKDAAANIDSIISGLRILNQRGDTDLVRKQLENVLNSGDGVDLGTHASQALASFLMFEVKDNDPFLRRFGKYINLETARVYNNATKRHNKRLSLDEYITGEYEDWEEDDYVYDENGKQKRTSKLGKSKRSAPVLLEGTSLDNVERTAFANLDDMILNAYTKDGKLDEKKYFDKRREIETAIGPAFISASLKYLSGSEQLKNAVSFLTGYSGNKPRWEDSEDALYGSNEAEKYFRERTIGYLENQTPSQILGLRSDYYDALTYHLADEYENTEMKGWSEEAIAEHNELMRERAEIQTRYGDLPIDDAEQKRVKDLKALRKKMAGAQFRQVLDSKGKLNQIYRTRRSGAANNAKDWVRDWLNLDDEILINTKLGRDKKRAKEQMKEERRAEADSDESVNNGGVIYDDETRAGFVTDIGNMWEEYKSGDDDDFYKESLKYVNKNLGKDSLIARLYMQFRKINPHADGSELKEYLCGLLEDVDNY